jgi:hypothetical protein
MPVQFSKSAVIEKNKTAIKACDESIDRLRTLGEEGLFADDEAERLIQFSRAVNERTNLKQINAHLRAAETVVRPMADQQIRNDLIANATIDFITSALTDVSRLRAITDAH